MSKNNSKETMQERIERMKREKEAAQKTENKSTMVSQLAHEQEVTTDFGKMAEEFEKAQEKQPAANEGYTKDTIYIKDPIYKAFNALCVNRGDKKAFVNEALSDFILKKYRELKSKK